MNDNERLEELRAIFANARTNPPSPDDVFGYVLELAEMYLEIDMPARAMLLLHDLERHYRKHHPEYFTEGLL